MAQSHSRKTIRKNPLDALGSDPVPNPTQVDQPNSSQSVNTNRQIADANNQTANTNRQTAAVSTSAMTQDSEVKACSVEVDSQQEQVSSTEQAGSTTQKTPVEKKNVEALFDEVLAPSAKSGKKLSFKPVLSHHSQHKESPADPQALAIVKTWSQWAALGGTVPAPIVDVALISGAQIKMLQLLCKHYGIPFEKKLTFTLVSSLLGGSTSTWLAQTITRTSLKSVPLVGTVLSLTAQPAIAFATTYAIGLTFVEHFESKGALLNFSADKMSGAFSRFYQAGRNLFKKIST